MTGFGCDPSRLVVKYTAFVEACAKTTLMKAVITHNHNLLSISFYSFLDLVSRLATPALV